MTPPAGQQWWRIAAVVLPLLLSLALFPRLHFDGSAFNMLPDGAVRSQMALLEKTGLVDRLFITLSSDQSDSTALQQSAAALAEKMNVSGLFTEVEARLQPGSELALVELLRQHLPVLLDKNGLTEVQQKLTAPAVNEALQSVFLLLNSPAGMGMKKMLQRDPLGLTLPLLKQLEGIRKEYAVEMENGFFLSKDGRHLLLFARSALPLTDSAACEHLDSALQQLFAATLQPGVQAAVVGALPHTLANSRTVQRDLRLLLPIASMLLLTVLLAALRSLRALAVCAIPFLGAPPAIAVTALLYGKISLMALGFGIVILGIAVDFAIHLHVGLRGARSREGQREALMQLRRPILFAALTTLAGLVVLCFSTVVVQRQMATLAICGILCAIVTAWLLIPLLTPPDGEGEAVRRSVQLRLPRRGGRLVLTVWLLFVGGTLLLWPRLHYSGELRQLDVTGQSAVESEFARIWGEGRGEQLFAISSGTELQEALAANSRLFARLQRAGFSQVQSLAPFLPGEEQQLRRMARWRELQHRLPTFLTLFDLAASRAGFSASAFTPFTRWLQQPPEKITAEQLAESALAPLLHLIRTPDSGPVLVLTIARGTPLQLAALLNGKDDPAVTLISTDHWRRVAGELLKRDILRLSLMAALAVLLLVAVLLRSFRAVAAAMAPVAGALAAMLLMAVVTGGSLNQMHLVAAILVIGLSVDYGIFVVCASRNDGAGQTFFAVSLCAASSLSGFGVLAFAAHPVLHSLGVTVLAGICAAWPTALWITPAVAGEEKR